MSPAVFAFSDGGTAASDLARSCGIPLYPIESRRFPDGESLVTVKGRAHTAFLYRSLDNPNGKLVEILLACAALRDGGATKVVLVSPYLSYMRQDTAFHAGEAVSQKVIGRVLASNFDGVVTVDPHLHRTGSLSEVMPGIAAITLSAAPVLASAIAADHPTPDTILVGPDSESRPWVEAVARPLRFRTLVGQKTRKGDREVVLEIPEIAEVKGRRAIIVDDLISSGTTLASCAAMLARSGARIIEAYATHCLAQPEDIAEMKTAGISRIFATNSTNHALGVVSLSGILANGIAAQGWLKATSTEGGPA